MAIEAILFDFDDTLVVEEASAEAAFLTAGKLVHEKFGVAPDAFNVTVRQKARELWYKSPAREYCVGIAVSSWEGLWARFEGDDPNLKIMRRWAPVYQLQTWVDALAEFGIKDESLAQLLSDTFKNHRRQLHIVYSDVEPVLTDLQQNYKLALVSNGASDLQREKLDGSRLAKFFKVIVFSGDIGIRKPQPEIFTHVLDSLGVGAHTAMMVGNSLKSDIAGARQVGLKTVWLNRDKNEKNHSVQPDYEINTLCEMQQTLNDLNQ